MLCVGGSNFQVDGKKNDILAQHHGEVSSFVDIISCNSLLVAVSHVVWLSASFLRVVSDCQDSPVLAVRLALQRLRMAGRYHHVH